jgi:DNA-binding CsgD family transcriptional regulator/tetratricopeptide (TPR) repeat protein
MATAAGEPAAARWLDAEDATMRQALAWAVDHDQDMAARLVTALSEWWLLRGRLPGQQPLLRELAERARPGSDGWCAAQFWLAWAALDAPDQPQALQRCAAIVEVIGDRGPSRALAEALAILGQVPEAAGCGRRALAMARELSYPRGQVLATNNLAIAAYSAGDYDGALRLVRQASQIPDIPGTATRVCGYLLAGFLAEAGDLAAAEQACAATLAQARDAGDMHLGDLLRVMADLDLRAGRTGDAAAHLREAAQAALSVGSWSGVLNVLEACGHLCAATGRPADAITAWAARETFSQQAPPDDAELRRREGALPRARQAVGPGGARAAEQRGAAMSLATAAEYALMLTVPGPAPSQEPPGAAALSVRERELVRLVAQGRTDAQIAAELYISVRTVRSHLDRIRDKTGARRRADLTRLALAAELV